MASLEERFEIVKEIGDGSFGSVALARVRGPGASIARKGSMIAIKTMKKTFDSFASCLELREVIFLRTLPVHPHLVPALDIFLDPLSRKLHICMEYMDGNLYQLMKARDHKCMDGKSVKSILYQILSGLHHVHAHQFFHRDIKPENILVSTSAPHDGASTFSRYSSLVTPPSTPPAYSIKIADFGLARENHSRVPFTTYVSTRWYRAPEVLLRAGEYFSPVDIWALGAMAVEIATLKPLFPGSNEVDQVWRVCEVSGSPGNWYSKSGARIGGGEWREGIRLAQKLGFSFPKMSPHSLETVLPQPQWPASFSSFVAWCLMWDPKNRPTSKQALEHEFFTDAVDPLRPRSSTSRLLSRKQSDTGVRFSKDMGESPIPSNKPSWFRRSLMVRDVTPLPSHPGGKPHSTHLSPADPSDGQTLHPPPNANKRSTWASGPGVQPVAPMPILPSIRPISPLSNAVTAGAGHGPSRPPDGRPEMGRLSIGEKAPKIGRQLSINSHGNHGADSPSDASFADGLSPVSPRSSHRSSFFSHLRKKARRFSGRHGLASPTANEVAASLAEPAVVPADGPSSFADESSQGHSAHGEFTELDKALQSVRYSLEHPAPEPKSLDSSLLPGVVPAEASSSFPGAHDVHGSAPVSTSVPVSSRVRRAMPATTHPIHRYETPEEEDELLDEVLNTATAAAARLEQYSRTPDRTVRPPLVSKDANQQPMPPLVVDNEATIPAAYPTPSPSANRNGVLFGKISPPSHQLGGNEQTIVDVHGVDIRWPTPPYEETEWCPPARTTSHLVKPPAATRPNFF